MRKGKSVDRHVEAESIELSGSDDWNSGDDIPYFFLEGLEDFLSSKVEEVDKPAEESMIAQSQGQKDDFLGVIPGREDFPDFLSGEDDDIDFATRDDVMEFADEIYDSFEEVFDIEMPDEIRQEWKDRTVYDESLGFKLGKTIKNSDFVFPMTWSVGGATAGIIGNTYRAWDKHDRILEETSDFVEADKALEQAMGLNDEIAAGALALGLAYGLKNSYPETKSRFTGKFLPSRPSSIDSLDIGGRDPYIAITPDKKSRVGAFYTGVAENLHMLQDAMNSPTSYDPLLNEGMDVFAKYLVAQEMEGSEVLDIDHGEKAASIRDDALLDAYGILKNNGGYMVDDDTFIDIGLDPEESSRMADHVEDHMARTDRSDEQLFGYSVGAAYLIMEYEKGNLDPAEVLREGRDAMPWQFKQIYDTPMMENV